MSPASPDLFLAFAAGLLSVLSPCVLPLMPAYLSLISGISVEEMRSEEATPGLRRRVMWACLGFVTGFSVVFIVMGLGAVAVGRVLRSWRADVFGLEVGMSQLAGVIIVLLGLHMMGLSPIKLLYRDTRQQFQIGNRSFLSCALVGAGFSLGWSPCIGPILTTILAVAGHRETWVDGVLLLSVYSAGLAIPFLLAGFSIDYFFRAFGRIKQHFRKLEVGSGVVLVGVGLLLVFNQFTWFNSQFGFMTDFINATEEALQ